jgi:hypothetical protein
LVRYLTSNQRLPEAESLLREEMGIWEKLKGVGSNEYAGTQRALVQFYEATGQSEQAAEWKKQLAEVDTTEAEKNSAVPKP